MGVPHSFRVDRAWETKGKDGVRELLTIEQDGEVQKNVSAEYWQGFIEEIIPERLSNLFFFDGEKIRDIAEDSTGQLALADAIKTLLGLDIVERLQSDLEIYKTREAKLVAAKSDKDQFDVFECQIASFEDEIDKSSIRRAELMTELDGLKRRLEHKETQLETEGGEYARNREKLLAQKAESEAQLDEIKQQKRDGYEGLYPFALCPKLGESVLLQIRKEEEVGKAKILTKELSSLHSHLEKAFSSSVLSKEKKEWGRILSDTFQNRLTEIYPGECHEVFGLSETESRQIEQCLVTANDGARTKMRDLSDRLEESTRTLHKIESEILKIPSQVVLQPIMENIRAIQLSMGKMIRDIESEDENKRKLEYRLTEVKRECETLARISATQEKLKAKIALTDRINAALDEYSEILTRRKIEELEETVAECFNELIRKGKLLEKIKIDPETFAVTLFDTYGNALPKESLSSGEKQMYAVAMLWALTKTSGRPLPIIIDTPLGRLDSDHRQNLIQHYFPKAADQVIILSTDTEVDEHWYRELSPSISHSFHLSYDREDNRTKVDNSYFWRK